MTAQGIYEEQMGNLSEARRLAEAAMGLAEEFKLTDEYPAKWLAKLLPGIRELLGQT